MNQDIAILEVRAAAGGDEAKIWAHDLLRMYLKYAERQGWKAELLDQNILRLKGPKVYLLLQHEAGVHRVQRIPTTEKHGRLHTSTATVAVLPEVDETAIFINPSDLEWQFYRASTQGGQNVQKVSSAVRLIQKSTGLTVTCEQERTQYQNREIALQLLRQKLWDRQQAAKASQISQQREAIGRGMRSEKIRTYNYPQSRITDHRLNKKFYNLDKILEGELERIIKNF
ncbi:hypothetical protein COU97_02800 [Candidatus Shapirobacteria bacterium CG10_big_fil_rev_8_21_14_0_10_48_15]|uniref:Peptide chain release factor domain-containing protein n=1 Tax=Candidatus Shapirobacteria bacterium CG10_big_fil_rev_8_21_14_0_10_48_15 TaxID=1974484 RepID=A0A2M8L6P0_9BACT|nr:MAG: hypothetical protein COU97_02800 [Candidatus Shapirobacteria bacterium CG10_big_fil_rev_8_21_14_0_10_48_15]